MSDKVERIRAVFTPTLWGALHYGVVGTHSENVTGLNDFEAAQMFSDALAAIEEILEDA